MATLSLTIFKAKVLKDGTHKIRIAVRHAHETRYIVTRFIVSESQFKNGQVIKRPDASLINSKLRGLLDEYQERLDSIFNPELYTCKQIKDMIQRPTESEAKSFGSVSDDYIKQLIEESRNSYATMIEHSSRTFLEFCRGDIPLKSITPNLIDNYIRLLKKKRTINNTSVNIMLSRLKVIVNFAIKVGYVRFDLHPFSMCKIASAPAKESDISIESLNKIRLSSPDLRRKIVARDIFMLSFYLGGINMIDLMNVDFNSSLLKYVRTKTKNTTQGTNVVRFSIPKEAMEIASKWIGKDGKLDFGYKFSYSNFVHYVTRSIQALAKDLGITERVVFYSARKTFAQTASEIGISDGIIDYCLGHSVQSRGVIRYYTRVRQKQAEEAIRKVIDYVHDSAQHKYENRVEILL